MTADLAMMIVHISLQGARLFVAVYDECRLAPNAPPHVEVVYRLVDLRSVLTTSEQFFHHPLEVAGRKLARAAVAERLVTSGPVRDPLEDVTRLVARPLAFFRRALSTVRFAVRVRLQHIVRTDVDVVGGARLQK